MPSIDQLQSLLEKSPEDAFLLYALALEHAKLGDHDAAVASFDKAIAAEPGNGYHYFHKARSLEALDRVSDALVTLAEGVARAKEAGDAKAVSELSGELDRLS